MKGVDAGLSAHSLPARVDERMEAALQVAKEAMDVQDSQEEYVVAGESRLIQQASANDMDKLRELFDAFEA